MPLEDFLRDLSRRRPWRYNLETVAVRPALPATAVPLPADLPAALGRALARLGVRTLYAHQAQALALVRGGRHAVLATGTASGKSLCFHLPALEAAAAGRSALFVYPTKALARDQLHSLGSLAREVGLPPPVIADGDTGMRGRHGEAEASGPPTEGADTPSLLLTNPDYLHCRLLPRHAELACFWRRLGLVVLDEIHVYEGIVGHRVAGVVDRLRRVCRHYGAQPTFVTATATARNPAAHASALLGVPCTAVTRDGSPRGRALFLLGRVEARDPLRRRWDLLCAAAAILDLAVARGIRSVAFASSRREVELILALARHRPGGRDRAGLLVGYRAGYLPETRRLVEEGLARGAFAGVVATSALELGVDLGPFQLCLLCDLPPSPAALRQRLGRVGRRGQASAVLLLADGEHAARARSWLAAAALAPTDGGTPSPPPDPWHPTVLPDQLLAAAAELPLPPADLPPVARREAEHLRRKGILHTTERGLVPRRPPSLPPLRGEKGPRLLVALDDHGRRRDLAVIPAAHLPLELPGSGLYLHLGLTFRVGGKGEDDKGPAAGGPPGLPAAVAAPRLLLPGAAAGAGGPLARERLGPVVADTPSAGPTSLELVLEAGPVPARRAGPTVTYLDEAGRRAGWHTWSGPPMPAELPALTLELRWDPRPPLPPPALRAALHQMARRLVRGASGLTGLPPGSWATAVQSPCPWTGAHRLILLCPGGPRVPLLLLQRRRRLAEALAGGFPGPNGGGAGGCCVLAAVAALLAQSP